MKFGTDEHDSKCYTTDIANQTRVFKYRYPLLELISILRVLCPVPPLRYPSRPRDRINALKGAKHLRLVVDLNHLRSDGRGDLAGRIMRRPAPYMYALREAARDVALAMDPAFNKTLKDRDILIGFEGR